MTGIAAIVAYYTEGTPYEQEAARLQRSCDALDAKISIRSYPDRESWLANVRIKPQFLLDCLREFPDQPLLYVDVDAVFHRIPIRELKHAFADVEIAAHFLRGKELLSGTLWLNGRPELTVEILRRWIGLDRERPRRSSQKNLQTVLQSMRGVIVRDRLPAQYCYIFDISRQAYPDVKPAIEHLQASRDFRRPGRAPDPARARRIAELSRCTSGRRAADEPRACDASVALPVPMDIGTRASALPAPTVPLTVAIVNDAEKDPQLLDYCLQSLRVLNADALPHVQLLIVDQTASPAAALAAIGRAGVPAEVINSGDEFVDGRPLWDLIGTLRRMRPQLRGRCLLLLHKEFYLGPRYLEHAVDWLGEQDWPCLVHANLRRLGTREALDRHRLTSCSRQVSEELRTVLDSDDPARIAKALSDAPSIAWSMHSPALARRRRGAGVWSEDLFIARLDWLDAVGLFDRADRLLFQDVYDLLGVLWRSLAHKGLAPRAGRLPYPDCAAYHLWHPKGYVHFNERVIEYFQRDPARWAGTLYADADRLRALRGFLDNPDASRVNLIRRFRLDPGGSVYRFEAALDRWLADGGRAELRGFYQSIGGAK